ncbi:hypothetical protein PSEMO_20840 [Pseudomonas putida]|uniref:Uncharacterized protein n=1 Tax=Pseudomonas putida TaxID=303 RepID=A0A1Q9R6A5_PSEPU|nr:hypothetical protein PSEMO_20840 [Pseudomonas putida]
MLHIVIRNNTDPVGAGLPAIALVNSLWQSLASQLPQGPSSPFEYQIGLDRPVISRAISLA